MGAWTKGPWKYYRSAGFVEVEGTGQIICQLWSKSESNFANKDDNGPLLAAAPDLHEACKLALNAFERNDAIDWSILEKAIHKAEGKS